MSFMLISFSGISRSLVDSAFDDPLVNSFPKVCLWPGPDWLREVVLFRVIPDCLS